MRKRSGPQKAETCFLVLEFSSYRRAGYVIAEAYKLNATDHVTRLNNEKPCNDTNFVDYLEQVEDTRKLEKAK